MLMRLPESSSFLGALLNDMGRAPIDAAGGSALEDVSEQQLAEALDAMAQGTIEYVILEDGEVFLQAAGEGDGPYQLQYCDGDADAMSAVEGGSDLDNVRIVMSAFLNGRASWRSAHRWTPLRA